MFELSQRCRPAGGAFSQFGDGVLGVRGNELAIESEPGRDNVGALVKIFNSAPTLWPPDIISTTSSFLRKRSASLRRCDICPLQHNTAHTLNSNRTPVLRNVICFSPVVWARAAVPDTTRTRSHFLQRVGCPGGSSRTYCSAQAQARLLSLIAFWQLLDRNLDMRLPASDAAHNSLLGGVEKALNSRKKAASAVTAWEVDSNAQKARLTMGRRRGPRGHVRALAMA